MDPVSINAELSQFPSTTTLSTFKSPIKLLVGVDSCGASQVPPATWDELSLTTLSDDGNLKIETELKDCC